MSDNRNIMTSLRQSPLERARVESVRSHLKKIGNTRRVSIADTVDYAMQLAIREIAKGEK